ncbi:hypothetical protein ACG98H_12825 [Corynebacterium sp. L4756]|uniref:hypothetical protein n=1 Tax=unclassified Corynebacterium TaxID=2624378 RepID=UPI00374CDCD8
MKKLVLNDRGSVTIEAALSLAVLVIVAAAIIGGLATMAAYISAVDIAGAAARAHAIGIEYQPPGEDITVHIGESAGLVTVTARVPAAIGTMSADAIFPSEVKNN